MGNGLKLVGLGTVLSLSLLALGCSGGGGTPAGGGTDAGGHQGGGAGTDAGGGGGGTSSFCCSINASSFDCPSLATVQACANITNPDPSQCTPRASACPGSGGGGGGGDAGGGGGATGGCGTGNVASTTGDAKICAGDDSVCAPGVCDSNTPNALNEYCTNQCSGIADCPCGANWTCEVNPKISSVKKFCKDGNKY